MSINKIDNAILLLEKFNNKQIIVDTICSFLNIFSQEIFRKDLLNIFLKYYSNNQIPNHIISKTKCFSDYIDIVDANIALYEKDEFIISTKQFYQEQFGKPEIIIPKLINILSKCKFSKLDSYSILEKCKNISFFLTSEQRVELYNLLNEINDPIKMQLGKILINEANSNEEIIYKIRDFTLWKYPDMYSNVIESIKKLDFNLISNELFNDFVKIFKNFNFYQNEKRNKLNKKYNYDKKAFFIILDKIDEIIYFPNIFWKLFKNDIKYDFKDDEIGKFANIFWQLFKRCDKKIIDEHLSNILQDTFLWFSINTDDPCYSLINLEQFYQSEIPEESLRIKENIVNTYVIIAEILSNNYNIHNYDDYFLDNFIRDLNLLRDDLLEILFNGKGISKKMIKRLNLYTVKNDDFFIKNSINIKIFKKLQDFQNLSELSNSKYYLESISIISNFYEYIDKFKCSFDELERLTSLSDEELSKKIDILPIEENAKINLIVKIKNKRKDLMDLKNNFLISLNYMKTLNITDNKDKSFVQKLQTISNIFEKDKHKPLEKITQIIDNEFMKKLNSIIERAKKFNKISFFKCLNLYLGKIQLKIEKEEQKFEDLLKDINEFRNLFDLETIEKINEIERKNFFNLFSSEEELFDELKKLKDFFEIYEENENLNAYLKFCFTKELTKTIVAAYMKTIKLLKLNEDIYESFEDIREKISDLEYDINEIKIEELGKNTEEINSIIEEIEDIGSEINLKIRPLDPISIIIKNLCDNDMFGFLFDLTNNDIRDLNNSLTGSSVDINDINNYLTVNHFIILLKKNANFPIGEQDDLNDIDNRISYHSTNFEGMDFFKKIPECVEKMKKDLNINDINEIIKNASNKKNQISELLKNKKGFEVHREEINQIMDKSKIEIFYIENLERQINDKNLIKGYNCKIIFSDNSKVKYYQDIIEMQQIASLSQNKNQENEKLNKFIELSDKLKDLINNCTILTGKGFPDYFNFEILLDKDNEKEILYDKVNNKQKTLDQQNKEIKNIMKKIDKLQMEAYNNYHYLKFFSGQQLFKINNYLKNKNEIKYNPIKHLLLHIMGNQFKESKINFLYKSMSLSLDENNINNENEINTNSSNLILRSNTMELNNNINLNDEDENIKKINEMFLNIEEYLKQIVEANGLNISKIFEDSIIKNKDYKNKKGIFISENKKIYQQALNFYKEIVGKEPPRYSILLCNEETTSEELLAFLYLATMCKFHSLFLILKPERLNLVLRVELQDKLEKIFEENKEINSLIIFLFYDIGKSDIGKEFLDMREIKKIDEPKDNITFRNDIEIVSSSLAGYGKSTYIKSEFLNNNLKYIIFPLGGEVKRSIIMRRLKELNMKPNIEYGLHIDLSETKQIELFEDFLFSFLVQKEYTQNEDIYCYQNNIKIKIEIPKGFYNFMDKFPILKIFKQKEITSLPPFKILNDIDKHFNDDEDIKKDKEIYNNLPFTSRSNILSSDKISSDILVLRKSHRYLYQSDVQIVCNYLNLYDSDQSNLKNKNLFFYGLNELDYESERSLYYYYAKFLDEKKCDELIKKYFNKPNSSYHQINIFIKVLAHQLKLFSNNYYLMIESIKAGNLSGEIRIDLINEILQLTKFFTVGAFDEIVTEQGGAIFDFNEDRAMEEATKALSTKEKVVNFDNLKDKSLVCIDEDSQGLTIITNSPSSSQEYIKMENLLNMFNKGKRVKLTDFNTNIDENIENEEERGIPNAKFLRVIKKYLDLKNKSIRELKNIIGSYTFTSDNFFKMIQILIRLKSQISVILMGETGCGKTSLVNTICELCEYKMITKNINASVTDNDIVAFIVKHNLLEEGEKIGYDEVEDEIENENELSRTQILNRTITSIEKEIEKEKSEKEEKEKMIIVFLDEFNTCNSQGLITEIMCEHRVQGKKIKSNVAFIGACNPYRKKTTEQETNALIKTQSKFSGLVYTVNPLTHSQLYLVLNFGVLSQDDEKKYIESIAEYELKNIIENNNVFKNVHPIMVEAFLKSQEIIRNKNGKESVSLREVRKFLTIYKFMYKDFIRKQKLNNSIDNDDESKLIMDFDFYRTIKNEEMIHKYAISVGIFICFYIRLKVEDRPYFESELLNILKFPLLDYPEKLQEELIKNIEFERGIAANKILKLNLFITFIGILTRIAVFLVGPPGCSKTLCMNLIKKSMQGLNSSSQFWKQYPQLIVTSFQGSLTCTSIAIKKSFDHALQTLEKWKKKNPIDKNKEMNGNDIISLVFIDEIGLCELSPSNPLKVLHSFLELDYKDKNDRDKITFVGISNWKLDASKMNRGIYLNVSSPESNEKDMIETANELSRIYNKTFIIDENNSKLINNLSKVVYRYKKKLNDIKDPNRYFHGTRDFYNMIKTVVRNIIKKNDKNLNPNILQEAFFSVECNYNGLIINNESSSSKSIENELIKLYPLEKNLKVNQFNIMDCIINNINDFESRFLLLITQASLSQYLVMQIIKKEEEERDYFYYLGSLFEQDKFNETYSAKAINKIRFYLEQPIILILKNLSTTYASLYDLLNQRYTYTLGKKYAEISIRDIRTQTFVHDNIRIIVLITKEALALQDPPFLNRFEKYVISFESLLDSNQKEEAKKFMNYKNLFKKVEGIKINPEFELINFYEEEIKGIIFDAKNVSQIENFCYEDYIFSKLAKTFPQELIAFLNIYKYEKYKDLVDKINFYYQKGFHSNLKNFLSNTENSKNIVYTFTSIIKLKFNFEINHSKFGLIKGNNFKHVLINVIQSERQLELILDDFYSSNDQNLLMFHFENNDLENLEFVSNYIERIDKEKQEANQNLNKIYFLIIHLKRSNNEPFNQIFMSNLSSFSQIFIDNLFGRDEEINEFLNKNQLELYNSSLINVDEEFKKNIYPAFISIKYTFDDLDITIDEYRDRIINSILNDNNLLKEIIGKILDKINKKEKIIERIFKFYNFEQESDFLSMIIKELKNQFSRYTFKFIVNSEKRGILQFYSKNLTGLARDIWYQYLIGFDFTEGEIQYNPEANRINIKSSYNLPSVTSIKNIRKFIELRKNEFKEQEDKLRTFSQASDLLYEKFDEDEYENEEFLNKMDLIDEYFNNRDYNNQLRYESIIEYIKEYFYFPKDNLIQSLLNVIKQEEIFKLFPPAHVNEGIILLFDDYYRQYSNELVNKEKNEFVSFIQFLTKLRFEKKDPNILIDYIKCILWLEIYKEEMTYVLNIIKDILEIIPNIIELMKQKIQSKEVEYIISPHHPSFKKEINYPFLIFLDSVCLILLENILKSNIVNLKRNITIYSNINKNAEILNSSLRLMSKDFYRFKFTYIISNMVIKKNSNSKEIIERYITSEINERKYIKNNQIKQASQEFSNQYQILQQNFSEEEGFDKLIISLIVSKYKEIRDEEFRADLCKIIKNNENLLKNATEFFVLVFNRFFVTPNHLEPNNDEPNNPFTFVNRNNILLQEINCNNNQMPIQLKIILRTIFKFNINDYFETYINEIEKSDQNNDEKKRAELDILIGENSFSYFNYAYQTLRNIQYNNIDEIYNKNIKEQFCIVYCNVYLENLVKFIIKENTYSSAMRTRFLEFLNVDIIPLKNTMKMIVLKLIKNNYITDKIEFLQMKNWSSKYHLESLVEGYHVNTEDSIFNLFYNGQNNEVFKQLIDKKISLDIHGGNLDIKNEQFFDFLNCFFNENFSNLKKKKNTDSLKMKSIISFKNYVSNKLKNQTTTNLINLFFDEYTYNSKMKNFIDNSSTEEFEILLYAYKLCLSCSLSNSKSVYSKISSKNIISELKKYYIPGADLYSDLWVESYYSINKYIQSSNKGGMGEGFYVCNCGEWYYNQWCGVPVNISNCVNCGKEIGGLDEKLTKRGKSTYTKEIIRIYYDQTNKNAVESRSDLKSRYGTAWYDSLLLSDFKTETEKKMNNDYKGILLTNYILFCNENKNIRNLTQISYRLLSFIIYSNIFFEFMDGNIKEADLKDIVPFVEESYTGNFTGGSSSKDDSAGNWQSYRIPILYQRKEGKRTGKDILNILKKNWEFLKKSLNNLHIDNIYCFMNIIFEPLNDLIKNSNSMDKVKERTSFENNVNNLIKNITVNYTYLKKNYLDMKNGIKDIYKDPILGNDPNVNSKYPYFTDLLSINTVSKSHLIEILNSMENTSELYPALISYLETDEKNIEYLQNITLMNEFVLFTIENYSYQITREEANSKKMSSEVRNNKIPAKPFENFKKAFNDHNIYLNSIQYDCKNLPEKGLVLKKLDEKKDDSLVLSSFLIDNGACNHGMQIAAAYQDFIKIQNTFLNNIKSRIENIESLKYLVNKMEHKIPPQKAKKCNIVSFKINTENYSSFLQMLLLYSYKDLDGNIKYDLNTIESELENILLPEKKILDTNQMFVIYQYEAFRANNSSVIPQFCEKFQQRELTDNEKLKLYDFKKQINNNEVYNRILFSIQLLIFYLKERNKEEFEEEVKVSTLINDKILPNYIHLSEETIRLFNENNFTIFHIFTVYEYFELLCYEDFKSNTDNDYKQKMTEDKKKTILDYFKKKDETKKGYLITKLILSGAVRKFISRVLTGQRDDREINPNFEIFGFMEYKEDIWKNEVFNNANFSEELNELSEFDIHIENAVDLYDILGGIKAEIGSLIDVVIDVEVKPTNPRPSKPIRVKRTIF